MKYLVRTLGCKANLSDSQLIEAQLQAKGWQSADVRGGKPSGVDLCIINSCTVTDEADRQSRKLASKMARDFPAASIVVTGCAAEVDPERLAASVGIHYVVGNQNKPRLVDFVIEALEKDRVRERPASELGRVLGSAAAYEELRSKHPMDREWPAPEGTFALPAVETAKTRAFLKIQEGCNAFCTYCVIPYGRGPARSLQISEVVAQIQTLVAQGVREVILTGTNIGDYGVDWQEGTLAIDALLTGVFEQTTLERLRISSLDPTEITPAMLRLVETEPRFCPHFHVSLQSPHPRILKLMKRKYGAEQVEDCLKKIAALKPAGNLPGGVFVGMDVIAGFPGETDEEFEWTLQTLRSLPWSRLHVFPYSERKGTPATRLPHSVPLSVRNERARVLRELSLDRLRSQFSNLKSLETLELSQILMEKNVKGPDGERVWAAGYTPNYQRVLVRQTGLANRLISATPKEWLEDTASGDLTWLA